MHIHIIAVLLFPVRLVTVPIAAPVIDGLVKAVSQLGGPPYYFWANLPFIAWHWILWY